MERHCRESLLIRIACLVLVISIVTCKATGKGGRGKNKKEKVQNNGKAWKVILPVE